MMQKLTKQKFMPTVLSTQNVAPGTQNSKGFVTSNIIVKKKPYGYSSSSF